ncbi:MAG: 2-phosphosulfolactate phosphatase, partial [Chloroflexia bacterium]
STSVDVIVGNGAVVYPYRWRDHTAAAYAESLGAVLASPLRTTANGYSLAPSSLVSIPAGTRLVLPSPNGSTLSLAAQGIPTFAGCLRNAAAVAQAAQKLGKRVTVIPAGERWPDGSLRPALEDLVGAGAIIHDLRGRRSPEAELAEAAFLRFAADLPFYLARCSSGKELAGRGFGTDVDLAAALNASNCVPVLREGAYVGDCGG